MVFFQTSISDNEKSLKKASTVTSGLNYHPFLEVIWGFFFFIYQAICNRKSKFLFLSPQTFAMCYFHILWAAPAPRMTLHWQQKDRIGEKRFHPSLCSDSPRLLHCNKMFSVSFASFILTASRGKIKTTKKKSLPNLLLTEAESSGPSLHQLAHLKPACDRGPHPDLYQDVRLSWMWTRRLFWSWAPFLVEHAVIWQPSWKWEGLKHFPRGVSECDTWRAT